ncbi:hypothetical protein GCM10008018_28430 [Paenibacillus marchantiophytorum]|uniref:DUF4025 domain-containing protein n=1 Tax=Paenibacillus marchantiophytorum TaxID=1619310 RepID=A0ABQ1EPC6_9BACL|nr:hypothetical protein [Paenibacillus marchantiophytorum]GFZ81152.1 hypothetical protein GCM10008018_28430 [Paenibacillus marchantiophytorum]
MPTNNSDDVVSHAINAAEANAEDGQSKQQVEELSSLLQNTTTNSTADEDSSEQQS